MAHLNQSKFGILKRDSCCPFEVLMLNRMEPITMLSSNQYSLWEPALLNRNITSTGIIYPLVNISNFSESYLFHKCIRKKKCMQAETAVYSVNTALSSCLQPPHSFTFYNTLESTSICLILVRVELWGVGTMFSVGTERLVGPSGGLWFILEPGRPLPKVTVVVQTW